MRCRRTQGGYVSFSPCSASVTVVGSTAPLATVTGPAEAAVVLTASRATATWSYYDAQGTAQAGWRVALTKDAVLLEEHSGTGTTGSYDLTTVLLDASSYVVWCRCRTAPACGPRWTPTPSPPTSSNRPPPRSPRSSTLNTGSVEVQVTIPSGHRC